MQSPVAVAALKRFIEARAAAKTARTCSMRLLVALIAIIAIGAVSSVGNVIHTVFWTTIASSF